jgi:hypothetical protein
LIHRVLNDTEDKDIDNFNLLNLLIISFKLKLKLLETKLHFEERMNQIMTISGVKELNILQRHSDDFINNTGHDKKVTESKEWDKHFEIQKIQNF